MRNDELSRWLTNQTCECGQDRRTCLQKLPTCPVERPEYRSQNQDQENLFQQRPLLPGYGHKFADLVDGPGPDQFDKTKDRSNALLQEFQQLIEDLFHGRVPATAFQAIQIN